MTAAQARFVALVAMALLAAGCGDDTAGTTAAPTPTTTSSDTSQIDTPSPTLVTREELEAAFEEAVSVVDDPELLAHLEAVKDATIDFGDPAAAVAAGYERSHNNCFPGAGKHYVNHDLVDDVTGGVLPEALMYEETPESIRLVGVEYYVPGSRVEGRPLILDQPAEGPDFIGGGIGSIYWLHIWLFSRTGALTLHSSLNSDVKCS